METPPQTKTTSSPCLAHSTIPEEKWELLVGYPEHKLSLIHTLMHQVTTVVTNDKDNKGMINHVKSALCANNYTEWTFRTPEKRKPATCKVVPLKQSINLCMLAISERSIRNITMDL